MMRTFLQNQGTTHPDITSSPHVDPEYEIINHIHRVAHSSGFQIDPLSITNLYVGLKSKPLVIIVGPSNTGKIESVLNLAKGLIGDDPVRCQMMAGHSWWANQHTDAVQYVEAQTRWNTGKIVELIQEANLPENALRIYIACLTRISPSEVNEFFSEVAFQLQHNELMRISSMHLPEPVHFPRNMFLMGTMDASQFKWLNEDLASNTSLILWNPIESKTVDLSTGNEPLINSEKTFLRSCLRNVQMAFQKLYLILKSQRQAFFPLVQTGRILKEHKILMTNSMIQSAMVYIANSWSANGTGLFSQDTSSNLDIALDLAIAQTFLLPIEDRLADSVVLRRNLLSIFRDRFPRCVNLVRNVG